MKRLLKIAEKEDFDLPPTFNDLRLHDIRRTFGSYQAITGASLQVIGKSLGHKSQYATQIYARLNLDPVVLLLWKQQPLYYNLPKHNNDARVGEKNIKNLNDQARNY